MPGRKAIQVAADEYALLKKRFDASGRIFEDATTTSTTFQPEHHVFRYDLRRLARSCRDRESR